MQHEGSRPSESADIRALLSVVRGYKWSILVITALTVGSALFFSFRQTPIYEATAQVLVTPTNVSQLVQGGVPAASLVSMDTERQIAQSSAVAQLAAEQLGAIDAGRVQDATTVDVPTNTQFLDITYSSPDPAVAQAGAQAVAESYLKFRGQAAIDNATRAAQGYREQITKLTTQVATLQKKLASLPPNSPDLSTLNARIDQANSSMDFLRSQLLNLTAQSVTPGQIVADAELPTSPSSPNNPRNGALALIVGLALGIGLAFLRERLDDRLAGREDFEMRLGAPVLAIVPRISNWKRRGPPRLASVAAPKSPAAEAYRTVRTNLQFIARDGSFKVLAIGGASQGEGKTTTAANLAVTLAQTGKRVVVISCDLRKPRLHHFFELGNGAGLSNVLSGQTGLLQVAQTPRGLGSLRVIASGPIPPNPAELLGSKEMETLLGDLRRSADFILIDTPPVLAVSDALALAPLCDGFVVVADAATTSSSALTHAREQLEQVGARIVGGILNNFDPSNAKYYPGYYRYYYAYQQRPAEVESSNGGTSKEPHVDVRDVDMWR
jgi:succinoglycan biosynthesis transport protein ExoP